MSIPRNVPLWGDISWAGRMYTGPQTLDCLNNVSVLTELTN